MVLLWHPWHLQHKNVNGEGKIKMLQRLRTLVRCVSCRLTLWLEKVLQTCVLSWIEPRALIDPRLSIDPSMTSSIVWLKLYTFESEALNVRHYIVWLQTSTSIFSISSSRNTAIHLTRHSSFRGKMINTNDLIERGSICIQVFSTRGHACAHTRLVFHSSKIIVWSNNRLIFWQMNTLSNLSIDPWNDWSLHPLIERPIAWRID